MSKFLKDLWYSYQMEKSSRNTAEEQGILRQIVTAENILLRDMSSEQKAFIHGIRFTMHFLTEALYSDTNTSL